MKLLSTTVLLFSLAFLVACEGEPNVEFVEKYAAEIEEAGPDSLLRHVVMFAFKDSSSAAEIAEVEAAFHALPGKIPEIYDYEWGLNNSPEGLNKGLTHVFFLSFKSEADRAVYLPHPAHQAFGKVLEPHLEDVTVVDYWSRRE